jgi:hypothetical protein
VVGGVAFFMLPLAGVLYAFVALIAWRPDREDLPTCHISRFERVESISPG